MQSTQVCGEERREPAGHRSGRLSLVRLFNAVHGIDLSGVLRTTKFVPDKFIFGRRKTILSGTKLVACNAPVGHKPWTVCDIMNMPYGDETP